MSLLQYAARRYAFRGTEAARGRLRSHLSQHRPPRALYSSLKDQKLSYTLLSDPGLEAAQGFHIAFHLDDEHYAEQLKWGVDLEKTTGTRAHALPVPSVFIIDAAGVIRFVYSDPDFKVRLSAQELSKAAAPLAPRQGVLGAAP